MKKLLSCAFILSVSICYAQNWAPVGKGMSVGNYLEKGFVYSFDTLNSNLYAGGTMDSAGGNPALCIASWNNTIWSPLGSGIDTMVAMRDGVFALASYKGNLYAAGAFDTTGGNVVNNIAEWNGTKWVSVGGGINGDIFALIVFNGNLYAGGYFDSAGGKPAKFIAQWNGTIWSPVGNSLNNSVDAFCIYGGNLYAGGVFDSAGGKPASGIAELVGTNWVSLGNAFTSYGYSGAVYALADYNNNLYVGGTFDHVGGTPSNNVAFWNGTTWNILGKGVYGNCCVPSSVQ